MNEKRIADRIATSFTASNNSVEAKKALDKAWGDLSLARQRLQMVLREDSPENEDEIIEMIRTLEQMTWQISVYKRATYIIKASNPDLDAVVEVVKANSFMSLRGPLTKLNIGKVDYFSGDMGPSHWSIKTRRGTIVIVSKTGADIGPNDIVVGNFVVGYI